MERAEYLIIYTDLECHHWFPSAPKTQRWLWDGICPIGRDQTGGETRPVLPSDRQSLQYFGRIEEPALAISTVVIKDKIQSQFKNRKQEASSVLVIKESVHPWAKKKAGSLWPCSGRGSKERLDNARAELLVWAMLRVY